MTTGRQRSSAKEPQNLQPHSPEAEKAALAAALQDDGAARKVSELSPAHFYDDRRREIFSAMQSLVGRRELVNVLTVCQELQGRGGVAKEIPITAIHDLEAAPPAVGYLATTIACLHKEARRRALIAAGTRLVEKTRENGRDEAELLGEFWEATKSLDVAGPVPMVALRQGDDFTYTQESLGVEVQISRARESVEGVQGELTVSLNGRALHWGRANLASLSARESLASKLRRASSRIPWADILEQVCRGTTDGLRATDPTVQLIPARGTTERVLLEKLLIDYETNVVFADGGTGKSLLGQALAVAIATKTSLPAGLSPRRSGGVLYLDWESCREEQEERLAGLLAGFGLSPPVPIHYRRMAAGLAEDMPTIRSEVARLQPALVIVDSLAPACGVEPEGTDAAIRTFNALRTLAPARLVLAHVSKVHADMKGATRPFGSVFNMNLPRNVWELRRAEEDADNVLTVGAYHRKTNRGRLLPPFGLQFEFGKEAIWIRSTDVSQDAGLRERAGLSYSIKAALRLGRKSVPQLAEELDSSEDSIRKTMGRLEKAGVVIEVDGQTAPGSRAKLWGLKAATGTNCEESRGVSK